MVLAVEGEVDVATSPQLRESLDRMVDEGHRRLVVDLSGAGFMDSSGLGVLVAARKHLHDGEGELAIVCEPEGAVRRILQITALDSEFPVFESVPEATRRA